MFWDENMSLKENYCLLGSDAVKCDRNVQTFIMELPLLSSEYIKLWKWNQNVPPKPLYICIKLYRHILEEIKGKGKDKAIPLQASTDPEGSRRLRLPGFKIIDTWRW